MSKFYVIHLRKKIPYYLHMVIRPGAGRFFYFSSDENGALDSIPSGYEISMNSRTKQPIIRRANKLKGLGE